ncbi:hypothetical protein SSBR45G_71820 [Bradyrhizobium sp. SSBR45G]|uniref:hypothetical protein n=1 Tax=unclassified Bradyrhizobium TaxID=2631580 RepID=UPI002342B505|nr:MULTISPECIES: hypothetical protein [unclassified Bradyrhizobium]GLH82273.1 hypothetical protein SSBR45G_71820 [Bradyrhizobium sp. SSBR45G]GLH88272.1 hypothetical protein SSBR45R_57330 [Bradyrhizobium sp. SSBR45R]
MAAAFTGRKPLLSLNASMAQLRMEVRDSAGRTLPGYGDAFFDLRLPGDHCRVAQTLLRMIRGDDFRSPVHSVHFFRDASEIGRWSVDDERAEMRFMDDCAHTPPAAA